jgi:hypothetical protein
MFVLLCCVITLHQVYATLIERVNEWPLRYVYLRCIEAVGRTSLPPIIVGYFFLNVDMSGLSDENYVLGPVIAICVIVFFRECFAIRTAYNLAVSQLIKKVNNPSTTIAEISFLEKGLLNYLVFNKISFDSIYLSEQLSKKGEIKYNPKVVMLLHNEFTLETLTGNRSGGIIPGRKRKKEKLTNDSSSFKGNKPNFLFGRGKEERGTGGEGGIGKLEGDREDGGNGNYEMTNQFNNIYNPDVITRKMSEDLLRQQQQYNYDKNIGASSPVTNPMSSFSSLKENVLTDNNINNGNGELVNRRSLNGVGVNVDSDDDNEEYHDV